GAIAVDGKNVYAAEYSWGAIGRAAKAGGGTLSFMTTHLDHVYGIAADDASVFFSTSSSIGMLSNAVPGVANDTDYDAAVPTTLLGTVSNAIGLILAPDGNLYWAENNDVGAVRSIPKAGASVPTVISADEKRPLGVAVDDANVYWTAEGANSSGDPGAPKYTD